MHRFAVSSVLLAAFLGCYGGGSGADSGGSGGGDAGAGPSPTPSSATTVDLPCEVATFVTARCLACHAEGGSAGLPLTSSAAFAATPQGKSATVGEIALQRLQDDTNPMPPSPNERATAAEIQALDAWIKGGYTAGTCDTAGAAPADPYATPTVCTSNTKWTRGDRESPDMHPGVACIDCHSRKDGPTLAFGGTVYPSAHEPDDCNGISGKALGATVVVTDANGKTLTAKVQASGNFFLESRTALAMPYTAKVVVGGKERAMTSPQSDGDCNGCHTLAGAAKGGSDKAPGRIMAP